MATIATDNRYAKVKWGQTKWGASTLTPALAWGVEVDWNGDAMFDNNESNRMIAINGFRGRQNMLQAVGSGVEPLQSGKYVVTLDNYDGRYDAWNTGSPLYPNVAYGKDVRIRVRDRNGTVAPYPVFYGIITDIIPYTDSATGARQVQVIIEDSWIYLRNNNPRVAVQTSITTDAAINDVLGSIGWPSRWGSALDVSSDTLGYFWALSGQNAGSLIQDLTNSGMGAFFISATGKATYRIRSDIPAATLSISQDMVYRDINPAQPWINLRNVIKLTVNPRTQAASGIIWQLLGNAPLINAGTTLKFFAPYTYGGVAGPATTVLQPTPTTDWLTNTVANGSGTDKTANCTLSVTDFGDTGLVSVKNNDAGDVYLTTSKIYGKAIYIQNSLDVTYPADITTITNPRQLTQNLLWQQDTNVAQSIVGVLGPFYGTTYPNIVIKMSGRPSQQFMFDLFDTTVVTFAKLGINGVAMRVMGIGMDSRDEACQDILTTFYLEPYPLVTAGAVYDTGVWDSAVYGW